MASALPSVIYLWIVPSEHELDQPGSWRIRKWDTEPFPEATHTAPKDWATCGYCGELRALTKDTNG